MRQRASRVVRLPERSCFCWEASWRDRGLRLSLESELLRRETPGESTDPGWALRLALWHFRPRDVLHSVLDLLERHGHGTTVHRWSFVQRKGQILRLARKRRRLSKASWVNSRNVYELRYESLIYIFSHLKPASRCLLLSPRNHVHTVIDNRTNVYWWKLACRIRDFHTSHNCVDNSEQGFSKCGSLSLNCSRTEKFLDCDINSEAVWKNNQRIIFERISFMIYCQLFAPVKGIPSGKVWEALI